MVPEGYYLKGPGQVAPCPKGEYKSGFAPAPSCDKCANGVSTVSEASISVKNCTEVLPTFYPADITNGVVTLTQKCPQKFYCPGGSPKQAFTPTDLNTITDTTVVQCDKGTWTENIGASSADQCSKLPLSVRNVTCHTCCVPVWWLHILYIVAMQCMLAAQSLVCCDPSPYGSTGWPWLTTLLLRERDRRFWHG